MRPTTNDLVLYYLTNRDEFIGEDGHKKLLEGLKRYIPLNTSAGKSGKQILGIDVGACVGDYIDTLYDICRADNANFLHFEPNPVNIAVLEPRLNKEKAKVFKHCLSNVTTKANLYNWKDTTENTSGNGVAGLRSGGSRICEVDVKRLDDVLDECGYKDSIIQFMKIDTEGNDSNVLKGCERYMDAIQYIIFECSDCLDDMRGPGIKNPMKDIVDYLDSHGFDTYRIGTKKLLKVNGNFWHTKYEDVKFWSNCFSLKKGDPLIHELIDAEFSYRF
jgi:FkbM family methyltransferase